MPNRPARFTVADLRRAVKAAEASGLDWVVAIDPDGTIRLVRRPASARPTGAEPEEPEIVLW